MVDVQCVWEEPAILGEGPLWVAKENAVYWVDIVSKKIHRYGVADDARRSWTFETVVTSLAERRRGGLVGTVRDGFAFIAMPVPNITSCTFAGSDLDTLYITTARHLLNEEDILKYPLSGSLFSCKPGVTGLPTPLFAG